MSLWGGGKITCGSCGKETVDGKFCGECGKPLEGTKARCGNCGANVSANSQFCGGCGKSLAESASPQLTGNKWARRADDLATRVDVADVDHFNKGLVVEAGTRALFFVNGAYDGVMEAGVHKMSGLLARIRNLIGTHQVTALLLDAADVERRVELGEIWTKDPLALKMTCSVVLRLDSETQFFENLLKGRQRYSLVELENFLKEELQNAAQEFLRGRSVSDISADLAVKQALEQTLSAHLARTLDRKGLSLIQIRVANFVHERVNEQTKKREEYWLSAEDLRVETAGGRLRTDAKRELLTQQNIELLVDVEAAEERERIYRRLELALKRGELTGADDIDRLVKEYDQRGFIREEELKELKRTYIEREQDHRVARDHLVSMLEVHQHEERSRAALLFSQAKRNLDDAQRSEEQAQLDHQLKGERTQALAGLAGEWARIQQEDEKARKEIERDRDEANMGVDLLQRMKAVKAKEEDDQLERDIRREQAKAETYRSLTAEGLIAMVGGDQAKLLADLRKTEMLKGYSEEQILAMAASGSPAVAQAIQEKYKAAAANSSGLLEQQKAHNAQLLTVSDRNADRMQEMFNMGMQTQRDTAVEAAKAGRPFLGATGTFVGAGADIPMKCPNCKNVVAATQTFCNFCGTNLVG